VAVLLFPAVTVMMKSVAVVVVVVAKNAVAWGRRKGVERAVEPPADCTVVVEGVAGKMLLFKIRKLVVTCCWPSTSGMVA